MKYISILLLIILTVSCSVDYKSNPNQPVVVPTSTLINGVQKGVLDDTRSEEFSAGQMLIWMQYWGQTTYTEASKYLYSEPDNLDGWNNLYANAEDLISIINLNSDVDTRSTVAIYGPNEAQIAAARVMLVYIYLTAVELWGDVPYYSYGSSNPDFQANQVDSGILNPTYAKQEDIYSDMLSELTEAVTTFNSVDYVIDGDNFYSGNSQQWSRFANSLKLRIANRIKDSSDSAMQFINEVKGSPELFISSNLDNAAVTYESNAENGAPMYITFSVDNEHYYAPALSFVELLKGKKYDGTDLEGFTLDPRLGKYVEPNSNGFYIGAPLVDSNSTIVQFTEESDPSHDIIEKADRTVSYMDYSEVCFILSEINGWDQTWYESGVRASMELWGVESGDIDSFISGIAPASERSVITQKYISLYMQPMEAWSEYRRTGYPETLIKPNTTYTMTWQSKDESGEVIDKSEVYSFVPLVNLDDVPYRNKYPINEQSINEINYNEASERIGGDLQKTKLWWMP